MALSKNKQKDFNFEESDLKDAPFKKLYQESVTIELGSNSMLKIYRQLLYRHFMKQEILLRYIPLAIFLKCLVKINF